MWVIFRRMPTAVWPRRYGCLAMNQIRLSLLVPFWWWHISRLLGFWKNVCMPVPLFVPGSVHSGSVSWDDCGWMFPDKLPVSSFQIGSHTMDGQRDSQPTPTSLGQGYVYISETSLLDFWQNDQGLLRATVVTQRWNWHRIRVST